MNELIIVLAVSLVLVYLLYSDYFNTDDIHSRMNEHLNSSILIEERKQREIPLYVYQGSGVSSRKWSSFYDRRHADHRSPLINIIERSYEKNHHLGPIVYVTDEMLLEDLDEKLRTDLGGLRGDVSLQHDRILRDALLLKFICRQGGILIPHNAILMAPTDELWKNVLLSSPGTIFYHGDGNSEYSCPTIISQGGEVCQRTTEVLLEGASRKEFAGGISFGGGSSLLFKRIQKLGHPITKLDDIATVDVDKIVEVGNLDPSLRKKSILVIPFPQSSGRTKIVSRDEWIYSVSEEDIKINPTILHDILRRAAILK